MQTQLVEGVLVTLELPADAQEALRTFGEFTGLVQMTLRLPDEVAPLIQRQANRTIARRRFSEMNKERAASPAEMMLVEVWNKKIIPLPEHRGELVNPPLTTTAVRAINTFGVDTLIEYLHVYEKTIAAGKHVWEGLDHSYSSLDNFLKKLLSLVEEGKGESVTKLWFFDRSVYAEDTNPKLTAEICRVCGLETGYEAIIASKRLSFVISAIEEGMKRDTQPNGNIVHNVSPTVIGLVGTVIDDIRFAGDKLDLLSRGVWTRIVNMTQAMFNYYPSTLSIDKLLSIR